MRIVRYLDKDGNVHHGAQQEDGSACEIAGDIFGEHTVTDRTAAIEKLLSPTGPADIFGIGRNYRLHAEEAGESVPEYPVVFQKNSYAVQNPGDPIVIPRHLRSDAVDYECELAVVIGKKCKNVSKESALDFVLGYTCGNDVSARDWQEEWGGSQFCKGKGFDTFAPLGPCLVTTDEITNPSGLRIRTILNGDVMQDSNTEDMIFDVPTLVEFLSGSTTLLPGTIILTGTPGGVGIVRDPPIVLKGGDEVTIDIERIGQLTNPVVEER